MQIETANEGISRQDPQTGGSPSSARSLLGRLAQDARRHGVAIAFAGLGVWTMVYLGLYGFAWTDYDTEVTPAYDALTAGHVWRFFQLAPAYGGSLELRAPLALLPGLWGGGEFAVYQIVALPCLIAAGALGVWLLSAMRRIGATRLARGTALGLLVANPITVRACELGHPEELLGAVLCVAAVLAAQRGHDTRAGLLLGLAIVNKEWALVAVGPVLLALPARRLRALSIAAALAVVFYAPLAIAQLTTGDNGAALAIGGTGTIFQPWQVWWFFGSHGHTVIGGSGVIHVGYRTPPAWLPGITHPLIVALGLPLTALAARRGRGRGGPDALLLLVGLLLTRSVLDPWDNVYYELPFIVALVVWESLTLMRPPVLGLVATVATWAIFEQLPMHASPDVQSAVFAAVTLPALAFIARAIFRRGEAATPEADRRATPMSRDAPTRGLLSLR